MIVSWRIARALTSALLIATPTLAIEASAAGFRYHQVPRMGGLCPGVASGCSGPGERATCLNLKTRAGGDIHVTLYVGNAKMFRSFEVVAGEQRFSFLGQPETSYGSEGEGAASATVIPRAHPLFSTLIAAEQPGAKLTFTVD